MSTLLAKKGGSVKIISQRTDCKQFKWAALRRAGPYAQGNPMGETQGLK